MVVSLFPFWRYFWIRKSSQRKIDLDSEGNLIFKRPFATLGTQAPTADDGPFWLGTGLVTSAGINPGAGRVVRLTSNLNAGARLAGDYYPIEVTNYFTGEKYPSILTAQQLYGSTLNLAQNIGNSPAVCYFYGQHLFFASSIQEPEKVWKSSLNNYNDFAKQPVLTPTGSLDFEIFTNDFSRVKYIRGLLEPIVCLLYTSPSPRD